MLYTSNAKGRITIMPSMNLQVSIVPGAGEMDDVLWDAIADSPTVTDLIEQRLLEVNEAPALKLPEKTPAKVKTPVVE